VTITLHDVHVQASHHEGPPILQDISCIVQAGEITLVIGKAGAGKSTLLQTIAGLILPTSGAITFNQSSLWQKRRVDPHLFARIGYVFQYPEHQLFAQTVRAEFAYSLKSARLSRTDSATRTHEALSAMQLEESIYERSPLTLSGGQRRRVAIATTLATKPDWLLLDEPTAGLDPEVSQHLVDDLPNRVTIDGGIIIATHDLDTFFPIADRVIVLHEGRIVTIAEPQWLCTHPELLLSCGIGLPTPIKVIQSLQSNGIDVPPQWMRPSELAHWIVQRQWTTHENLSADDSNRSPNVPDKALAQIHDGETPQPVLVSTGSRSFIKSLDPRAKWLCYLAGSVAMLLQNRTLGLILSTLTAVGLVFWAGISWRQFLRSAKPFLYLTLFSVILSGLRFSPADSTFFWKWLGFSFPAAWVTFRSLYKLLLIMILGGVLAATTTQLRMKRGLEQALSGLKKWKLPVEAFSLGTSLVLRFIPVIVKEVRRFSMIVRARGKSHAKVGSVRFRDLPALVIPLMLSIFQFGEDLSIAMEARGYTDIGIARTAAEDLRFTQSDWVAVVISLGFLLAMLFVSAV
jgi:energy-coupling factor transporter ATP-binding protein EcfA2/energy-coupling factor transporter transmembrane protein EcfT